MTDQYCGGTLHEELRAEGAADLMGKCMDLESAYKQLPVAAEHAHLAILGMKNPKTGEPEYFEMARLPFGASAAVHGFNRVVQAIESILKTQLGIPCTHYFDDFTFVLPRAFGEAAIQEVRRALSTLGRTVAGGDKDPPLKQKFCALGVEFDLSQATQSTLGAKITACNTQNKGSTRSNSLSEPFWPTIDCQPRWPLSLGGG